MDEEIVPECQGCERRIQTLKKRMICAIHKYPLINWWFGESCPQATHINRKPEEDPIKEP